MTAKVPVEWLLDSDPALRWQVERDLLDLPEPTWAATRARVGTEGFGARLLALQGLDGQWAGGAFFPAGYDFTTAETAGQPWTATTWSLSSLREWGVDASALAGTAERLAAHARWEYDDLPYWGGEVDCCINSWTLSNGLWLGADVDGIVDWFLEHRMDDGGWNCEWVVGSTRSSFHSTLNTLKGLLDYEQATGDRQRVREARLAGQEYLLARSLFRRRTTAEPVAAWALRFAYPFRWYYSVLNAADYFRSASLHDGTPPDPRMGEAVELVRAARRDDGTWEQERRHPGEVWFEVDAPAGEASRWLTLIGARVLRWWDGSADGLPNGAG
ncbi:squalene cyclase [Cellulomonas wangsupingiae]|uniref:Squalene cyclase n=1 Tax=Cellulomonas wangsupingiae TaxID=2968085 RepID=A0ABY5K661_9CELL|nr:squalene cyclase [Cellulomonas wangsupingiae]MCC2334249.1 squalene cyclase [Cellulomonas wangsupingiae]MCM0641249.1 squalene cyclase [Cellulomonas wangsupingiae]UUI65926.1 squalene cyclase [Cellulomonas wangsupingiae]